MERYTTTSLPNGTASWTAPAGVTEVFIMSVNGSVFPLNEPRGITVVPNTTYNITINSSSFVANNANTFGSLYSWTGSNALMLMWVE